MTEAEFGVLGIVEAHIAGKPVDLGTPRQRAVLAALVVEAGRAVHTNQLIQRVWEEPPAGDARPLIATYISRLRRVLSAGPVAIPRRQGGYLIDIDPESVDMHRYSRLVQQARSASDDDQAVGCWQRAMVLWRGRPFQDLEVPWLDQVAQQLTAEHWAAQADYRDLRLRRGEHTELIPELQAAAGSSPLDERVAAQLMLALYRGGRQADALTHYEALRRRLADELGSDPAPASRQLHQQILASAPELAAPEPPVAVRATPGEAPVTLPWDTKDFTGRAPELDRLHACAAAASQPATAGAVVISGSGGVGKTALAVHWAHCVRDQFPDGQLYVNLQGFSEQEPLASADALHELLRQLGVPGARIPFSVDSKRELYRQELSGRRILVILDNAADSEQVRPLLVGSPCLAVVTSRNRLTGLAIQEGASELRLGRLSHDEANGLVRRLLGEHHPEAAAARLNAICARLPLAIRLAAAGFRIAHPDTSLASYLDQLEGDRIGLLDAAADRDTALTGVLSRSVQRLTTELARAFRLAGLHPGPRMDVPAIAALLGVAERPCRRLVRELAGASLLEETSPDRWSMHDLLAEHARDSLASRESEAGDAYRRLLEHYTDRLSAEPVDHQWIHEERAALLACMHLPVAADVRDRYALRLGGRLFELDLYADSRHTYELLRQRCPADSYTYAMATFGAGRAHVWLAEPTAGDLLREALCGFQRLDDPQGQARTLRELTEWNRTKGIHQEEVNLRALELFRTVGDLDGEAFTLTALAYEANARGDYPLAHERGTRALQIARQIGSKRLQGESHQVLGRTAQLTGDPAAMDHLSQARDLYATMGYQIGWATCVVYLGDLHAAAGRHQRAIDDQQRALEVYVTARNRTGEAFTCLRIGKIALAMDDPVQARVYFTRALQLNRQIENGGGIAFSHIGIADLLLATGMPAEAAESYRQAAADLADLEFPRAEAEARTGLGRALTTLGDYGQARQQIEFALRLYEKINSPQAAKAREALEQLPHTS